MRPGAVPARLSGWGFRRWRLSGELARPGAAGGVRAAAAGAGPPALPRCPRRSPSRRTGPARRRRRPGCRPASPAATYAACAGELMLQYKERGRRGLAAPLGAALAGWSRAGWPRPAVAPVVLVPVPGTAAGDPGPARRPHAAAGPAAPVDACAARARAPRGHPAAGPAQAGLGPPGPGSPGRRPRGTRSRRGPVGRRTRVAGAARRGRRRRVVVPRRRADHRATLARWPAQLSAAGRAGGVRRHGRGDRAAGRSAAGRPMRWISVSGYRRWG